jgi:lysophospholipase L1-like esterase
MVADGGCRNQEESSMSSPLRTRARLVALLVIVASLVAVPVAQAKNDKTFNNPKQNYVALGDSLAFGYQGQKVNACAPTGCTSPDTLFNTGYVNGFVALMQPGNPHQTINFGCPGETSSTLLNNTNATTGCVTYPVPIHQNHPGKTQIAAAVDFLSAHANQTNPVTIDIGANDLLGAIAGCGYNPTCIAGVAPGVIATVAQNTTNALAQLNAAAPRANIIVLGLYNPLFTIPGSDALTQLFNSTIANVAANAGAQFADPFQTINHGAAYPNEAASVCSQIAICAFNDVHPFDNGYQAIAAVVFGASGF